LAWSSRSSSDEVLRPVARFTLELLDGLLAALSPANLGWAVVGAVVGTLVGILPGLGPAATVALLIPFTSYLPPATSLILLCGIYYGAQYGGSTTSILLNLPGESASVVTCLDGYPLALQGRGGEALALSAVGSFVAGTIGLILFSLAAAPLADIGLAFGPPEQFMLMVMALVVSGSFGDSLSRGVISAALGLLLAFVGADPISGINRFVFGVPYLYEGIGFVPAAVGLFAVGEVFSHVAGGVSPVPAAPAIGLRALVPQLRPLLAARWAMVRGSLLGFFFGLLPGAGPVPASFISYSLEKRLSPHPERFGRGAIEGVAAPESANNSAVVGSLLPMFSLGIPGSATTAILLGGLLTWGLQPGPMFLTQQPEVVWTVIGSLYVANLALLLINLPGAALLAQIARVPPRWMMPAVLAISLTGAFAADSNLFAPVVALAFGVVGYLFRRVGYPLAPLLLGLVLGEALEQNVRRSLMLSRGDATVFLARPLSLSILLLTVALVVGGHYVSGRQRAIVGERKA
jgi:putative tricarboxylic transport membrane protein